MRPILPAFALAFLAAGCAVHDGEETSDTSSNLGSDATIPRLPEPGGMGDLAPWGGSDPSRWRGEAILANAASRMMNLAWERPGVKDVVVAVPVKIWSSGFREFGDGQANARVELEAWSRYVGVPRPPVVAAVIKLQTGPARLHVRFDRALPYAGTAFELRYNATTLPLTAVRDGSGDAVVEINVPSDLSFDDRLSDQSALIHPAGWADWFPLHFRMPVKRISELRASSELKFSHGKSVVDREHVTSVGASDGKSALERLGAHSFTARYNGALGNVAPYAPGSIHATYPFYGTNFVTGVGRGWTWVADERPNGFKVMYTCFERRRQDLEASAPDGGVASGGGWHQINDAAETIMNDVETGPVMVASGKNNVWLESDLPTGRFAYGITDVATFRWLRPGEAFITIQGGWTQDRSGRSYETANYHWYFFHQNKDVCTEELINPAGQVPYGYNL